MSFFERRQFGHWTLHGLRKPAKPKLRTAYPHDAELERHLGGAWDGYASTISAYDPGRSDAIAFRRMR